MRISKTIALLFVGSLAFIVSTVIAQDKMISVESGTSGEDAIFAGVIQPKKGVSGLPPDLAELSDTFSVQLNEEQPREPASVAPLKKSTAKPTAKKVAAHWSTTTKDGFEFKIRVKQQLSAVWVMKRDDHFDLIFANNNGSRVNLTIPAAQFYALKSAASDLRAPASDISKCKDNFIQLELVEESTHKKIEACLSAKGKQVEDMRQFGNALTAIVR